MEFSKLTTELGIRMSTVSHLCADFGIDTNQYKIGPQVLSRAVITPDFEHFLRRHIDFLKSYERDYYSDKSPSDIAETIQRPLNVVEPYLKLRHPEYFVNGEFIGMRRLTFRYVSSYKIDQELGRSYEFLTKELFAQTADTPPGVTETAEDEIVGYEDVKTIIKDILEPLKTPTQLQDWGLNNPGGILLFGPPGCGKTHWAKAISGLVGFEFKELPRSEFGSSYVDGAMTNLKTALVEVLKQGEIVLFFDEFDSVASNRSQGSNGSRENAKVVNTLLQEIPKLIEKRVVVVGATNFLDQLDPAVIRPGRFDLKIPIFPPNTDERALLIAYHITKGLKPEAKFLRILERNKAHLPQYWLAIAETMALFSVSHIVDFTLEFKRLVKKAFESNNSLDKIDPKLIREATEKVKSKITAHDVELLDQFYVEVKNIEGNLYDKRLTSLKTELDDFNRKNGAKRNPIGFNKST